MKRFLLTAIALSSCLATMAQTRQVDKKNNSMLIFPAAATRTEIILPEVNGYKIIKADLHVHTNFSDASVTPAKRVAEGWEDGLDAIAITDHIEHRPNEKKMIAFLNEGVTVNENKDNTIKAELNFTVSDAKESAKKYGITIIPGTEITRNPVDVGHFNALFTKDNNLIPDPDPLQAIKNAKKQGAIVQSNHPGWRRTDNDFTDVAKAAINDGLIDGVEVFNSTEFYPDVIETAQKNKFYICSTSDIHALSHEDYGRYGVFRNMTLILAKDSSLESIRDGLEQQRTLAYSYGDIAGCEQLLKDFFLASFDFKVIQINAKGVRQVLITNKTSFPYVLNYPSAKADVTIRAFSSILCTSNDTILPIKVMNMWLGPDKHPEIRIELN